VFPTGGNHICDTDKLGVWVAQRCKRVHRISFILVWMIMYLIMKDY